jgi:hypothetical protein
MSPWLLLPLLAAHLVAPVQARVLKAGGLVVEVSTSAGGQGNVIADLEVRGRGVRQHIRLEPRAMDAQRLLASVEIVDANFDGHPDIVVVRDWGAKWEASDVFLYDPAGHRFTNASPLARSLSELANVTFDVAHHALVARSIGPSNPSRVTYTVTANRLRVVESCRFINPVNARVGTLVRSHGAETTYTRVTLSPVDVEPCGQ